MILRAKNPDLLLRRCIFHNFWNRKKVKYDNKVYLLHNQFTQKQFFAVTHYAGKLTNDFGGDTTSQ